MMAAKNSWDKYLESLGVAPVTTPTPPPPVKAPAPPGVVPVPTPKPTQPTQNAMPANHGQTQPKAPAMNWWNEFIKYLQVTGQYTIPGITGSVPSVPGSPSGGPTQPAGLQVFAGNNNASSLAPTAAPVNPLMQGTTPIWTTMSNYMTPNGIMKAPMMLPGSTPAAAGQVYQGAGRRLNLHDKYAGPRLPAGVRYAEPYLPQSPRDVKQHNEEIRNQSSAPGVNTPANYGYWYRNLLQWNIQG